MAKEPKSRSEQRGEAELKYAAATVHTYESFGRAIVAAGLTQAAKQAASGKESAINATVRVAPLALEATTFFKPGEASSRPGPGAEGRVDPPPPIALTICFGDDCYTIGIP